MELDRYDRQLLRLVQDDIGVSAQQLATEVPLSASSIQRRLRRMRESGIIDRGRPTLFVVSLRVERERPDVLEQLRRWLIAQDHVQQAFYVTGESDFVLIVAAPDTASYEALMSRLLHENLGVTRFTTQVALSVVKRGLSIPIPPAPAG